MGFLKLFVCQISSRRKIAEINVMVLSVLHVYFWFGYRSSIVSPFLWILYDSSEIQKSGENVESMY